MKKTFDRVSWPFLFKVLKCYGFPKVFRKLIKACVKTVSLQVLINDTPSSRIFLQCGLRQGDPISPYLFILCMEILSLMITKAETNGLIEGIKLSRQSPAISHLLYVDDSLLCLRLTSASWESLRSILNNFSSISGQMINHQKSYTKFSPNTSSDFKENILDIIQVHQNRTSVYILASQLIWEEEKLAYVASVLPIPQQITSKINYLIDIFWWKKAHNKHAQHWLSFEQLQLPKSDGGLRLKNARLASQALLTKNFWRCHQHPSLLVSKVLRSKYHKYFPIPGNISKYSATSFAWNGVVKTTYLLHDGIAWKFGNGRSIDLKNDACDEHVIKKKTVGRINGYEDEEFMGLKMKNEEVLKFKLNGLKMKFEEVSTFMKFMFMLNALFFIFIVVVVVLKM
ncbi:uncharacterized protein LOC141651451 [Silene latifolia]|uniref:uncharacterized protein LOC141651451 n=1 Tax=Silene latifolia TaxID=37657 RepID=UPI003D76B5C0